MAKKKILVVEDEFIIATEIQERLETLNYTVTDIVTSKKQVLEAIKKERPNLVLMDIMLGSDMAGFELSKIIHDEFDIPVVFLTAYSDEETLQQAKLTEPFGYILKPIEERELRSTIEIALYKYDMEKKLKESEQWFFTTLKCIGDAVITTDTKGKVTFMNQQAELLTGWQEKEALHKDSKIVFHITNGKDDIKVDNPVSQVLKKNSIIHLQNDTVLISKDGSKKCIEDSAAPIRDAQKNIKGVVLVFRDIGDRKKLEEQLRQAQKMEAIGTLSGGIAHDFNNLLTAIQGSTDLALLSCKKTDPLYQYFIEIQESAHRAAELTKKLLLFSRLQPLEFKPVNINHTVNGLLKMLNRIIGEPIQINTSLKSHIPDIKADEGTLEQIIVNLAINAKEAMPKGGNLTIKTKEVHFNDVKTNHNPEAYSGHFVCLSVIDEGIGIDSGMIKHIFDPFFTTKKDRKGSGLGLSVVYGIVKEHCGWIEALSKSGLGTAIKIYLPAIADKTVTTKFETTKSQKKLSIKALQGNGERILLVEDETKVRQYVKTALDRYGYVTSVASSAKEATAIYQKEKGNFQLVFSDVVLPDKSGVELARGLLAINPKLHILLTSGYPEYSSKWSDIQKENFELLQKPFNLADLLQKVRDALQK
jgi:two-component system cell cycle sensor histidine kinase/response regulator CckA